MSKFQRQLSLLSLLFTIIAASIDYPTSRTIENEPTNTLVTAPQPAESFLKRLQPTSYATCGYRDGRSDRPFVCTSYSFCNSNNQYSIAACCITALTSPSSQPYACAFYTACYDSTQSKAFSSDFGTTLGPGGGYDGLLPLYCGDSALPYCIRWTFTDNKYALVTCGAASGVVEEYGLSYHATTTVKEESTASSTESSVTVLVTTQITSIVTSNDYTVVTTLQSTSSSIPEDSEQNDTSSSKKTGVIIGGAVGGAAALAIVAAIAILLRHKKKRKQTNTDATQPSFSFICSNISAPPPPAALTTNTIPSSQARLATPCLSEVDGDSGRALKPVEVPSVGYQPYRHPESKASVSTFGQNNILPFHSQHSASIQPRHFDSISSFMPLSEVDGMSAESSRNNTNIPPERRQSRFAELDAPHMSMQSGPIPEWDARELP